MLEPHPALTTPLRMRNLVISVSFRQRPGEVASRAPGPPKIYAKSDIRQWVPPSCSRTICGAKRWAASHHRANRSAKQAELSDRKIAHDPTGSRISAYRPGFVHAAPATAPKGLFTVERGESVMQGLVAMR